MGPVTRPGPRRHDPHQCAGRTEPCRPAGAAARHVHRQRTTQPDPTTAAATTAARDGRAAATPEPVTRSPVPARPRSSTGSPPLPQSPLHTSSTTTHVTGRMFSLSMFTIASVRPLIDLSVFWS